MACIPKVQVGLTLPCGAPNASDLGRPLEAKFLNAQDIASFTVSGGVASITRVKGGRAYAITAVNNALTLSVGLKSQDIMPGAYDVTVTFKNFATVINTTTLNPMGIVDGIARMEMVLFVKHASGKCKVYGLGAPLVCLELSGDSVESDFYKYTYGVEDWQVGTTIHNISLEDYEALDTPVE
jgi:hypothetical protein